MAHEFLDAQQAVGFVASNLYNVEQRVYQTKYPSYNYADYLPIVTEGNEWAIGTTFYSGDSVGTMEWFNAGAYDVPNVGVSQSQFTQPFHMSAAGITYTLEEVMRARMTGRDLPAENALAARRAAEKFAYETFLLGKPEKNMQGLFNYTGIPTATAAANASGQTGAAASLWANKTQDQILQDINAVIIGVYNSTLETEMADTIILPTQRWLALGSTARTQYGDTTTLGYLETNNVYTAQTGQRLRIMAHRALATAGTGGTARMIAYRRDPEVLRGHLPMPFRLMPDRAFNKALVTEVPGIMRIGGTEIRLPNAVSYLDGL